MTHEPQREGDQEAEAALQGALERLAQQAPIPRTRSILSRLHRRTRTRYALGLGSLVVVLLLGTGIWQHALVSPGVRANAPAVASATARAAQAVPTSGTLVEPKSLSLWSSRACAVDQRQALASWLGASAIHVSGTISKLANGELAISLMSDGPPVPPHLVATMGQALAPYRTATLTITHGALVALLVTHPLIAEPGSNAARQHPWPPGRSG